MMRIAFSIYHHATASNAECPNLKNVTEIRRPTTSHQIFSDIRVISWIELLEMGLIELNSRRGYASTVGR